MYIDEFKFDPNKFHPLFYSLRKVDWSLWGTLTWHDSIRRTDTFDAEKLRQADFATVLENARAITNLRRKDIAYYHATEYGNANESHLHFLLLNKRSDRVSNDVLASKIQELWNTDFILAGRRSNGAGTAVVEPYDKTCSSPAVSYCLKREFNAHGRERERYDKISENLLNHLVWLAK